MNSLGKQFLTFRLAGLTGMIFFALIGSAAQAEEGTGTVLDVPIDISNNLAGSPSDNTGAFGDAPFSDAGLSAVVVASSNAVVQSNSMQGNFVSGDNAITANAFQNANGVVNVLQNSGSQVSIQAPTVINMTFQGPLN